MARVEEQMSLLSIDEITSGLDREFEPLEPMLSGFRLTKGGATDDVLRAVEASLDVTLPSDFRGAIARYDFGNLTIGPVAFCFGGNYPARLQMLNSSTSWWGRGPRPPHIVMIANSDPYLILLDVGTNEVLVADHDRDWPHVRSVAASFDLYLRGLGTTILRRNDSADRDGLARLVAEEVGTNDIAYWEHLSH